MLLILFILFLLFVFIPLPIFISLDTSLTASEVKLYGFRLNLNKKNRKWQKKIKSKKATFLEAFQILPKIMDSIGELRLKPILHFNSRIEIGLDDAAYTAVTFGLLNSLCPIVYKALNLIFKITNFNFRIYPDYKNAKLNLNLKCTIIINIFFVIYLIQKGLRVYLVLRKNIAASALKESI